MEYKCDKCSGKIRGERNIVYGLHRINLCSKCFSKTKWKINGGLKNGRKEQERLYRS